MYVRAERRFPFFNHNRPSIYFISRLFNTTSDFSRIREIHGTDIFCLMISKFWLGAAG